MAEKESNNPLSYFVPGEAHLSRAPKLRVFVLFICLALYACFLPHATGSLADDTLTWALRNSRTDSQSICLFVLLFSEPICLWIWIASTGLRTKPVLARNIGLPLVVIPFAALGYWFVLIDPLTRFRRPEVFYNLDQIFALFLGVALIVRWAIPIWRRGKSWHAVLVAQLIAYGTTVAMLFFSTPMREWFTPAQGAFFITLCLAVFLGRAVIAKAKSLR